MTLTYSRAQSDTSKGMTKKLLPEFDPEGWNQLLDTMLAYGKAYFRERVQAVLHKKHPLTIA